MQVLQSLGNLLSTTPQCEAVQGVEGTLHNTFLLRGLLLAEHSTGHRMDNKRVGGGRRMGHIPGFDSSS